MAIADKRNENMQPDAILLVSKLVSTFATREISRETSFFFAHETSAHKMSFFVAHETSAHETIFFCCSRNECSRTSVFVLLTKRVLTKRVFFAHETSAHETRLNTWTQNTKKMGLLAKLKKFASSNFGWEALTSILII